MTAPPAPSPADTATLMADLLARIVGQADRAAFGDVFAYYAPRVKSYLLRLGTAETTAEEIVQEVMLTVWRRADSYDPALASVGTWIFTIARNRRIDFMRREQRPELDAEDPLLQPEAPLAADVQFEARQSAGRLRAALADLPPEQAHLLQLAYFSDRSHRDIAESERLPLGTVKSRIRLALGRLRDAMSDKG